ncbi:hypothetical protein IJI31_06805 [bacterium]|nr:hypothetical protein [bacterium]
MNISPVNMTNNIQMNKETSFNGLASAAAKGGKVAEVYDGLIEKAARKMVAPVLENSKFTQFLEKTANITDMPNHLSTLGAAATSGFYVRSTLKNDKLQKQERKTLALNQALVFVVSTLGAYFANDKIGKFVDNVRYKYIEYNQHNPKLGSRITGFKTASGLMVFALMYRYISPVVVTPIASAISKSVREHKAAKKAAQANNVA